MTETSSPRGYLTPEQAAERTGDDVETVRRKCQRGQLPAQKTDDGGWLIHAPTLEKRLLVAEHKERFRNSGTVVGFAGSDFEPNLEATGLYASESGDPADAIPIADDFRARRARHEQEAATWRRCSAPVRAPAAMTRARPRARGAGCPRAHAVARASSRGGDSGDDGSGSGSSAGDGDPPQTPSRRPNRRAAVVKAATRNGGAPAAEICDQLERLGRKPLQPRRRELRPLAARFRERAAVEHGRVHEDRRAA